MDRKHSLLHELLQKEQEPFFLKNYIADRRFQLKRTSPTTTTSTTTTRTTTIITKIQHLQVKKRKQPLPTQRIPIPSQQQSRLPQKLYKGTCFFAFNHTNSPIDPRKSPLFHYSSPASRSPCNANQNGRLFFHIPARTAALLLEAAARIQKPKPQSKNNNGFNVFGSLLKRLTNKNSKKKSHIYGDGGKVSVKEILSWDSSVGRRSFSRDKESEAFQVPVDVINVCSCNRSNINNCRHNTTSSVVWSEEKCFDLDTLSSCYCSCSINSSQSNVELQKEGDVDLASYEKNFCESPFHFVLERTPSSHSSPGGRTPNFSSPVGSPSRHKIEVCQ